MQIRGSSRNKLHGSSLDKWRYWIFRNQHSYRFVSTLPSKAYRRIQRHSHADTRVLLTTLEVSVTSIYEDWFRGQYEIKSYRRLVSLLGCRRKASNSYWLHIKSLGHIFNALKKSRRHITKLTFLTQHRCQLQNWAVRRGWNTVKPRSLMKFVTFRLMMQLILIVVVSASCL